MERKSLKELWALKKAYRMQKIHAADRGIPFLLTFIEWLTIWRESGHLHERGCHKGQYVMARFDDKGSYVMGNVKIILHANNIKEGFSNPEILASMCEKLRQVNIGRTHTPETKEKIRESLREWWRNHKEGGVATETLTTHNED